MQTKTTNPYATPQTAELEPDKRLENPTDDLPSLTKTLGKWTAICILSAAPSFFFGLAVSSHPLAIPAMLLGVAMFAAGYTFTVRTSAIRKLMALKPFGSSIRAAFATRLITSIIVPLGMMNDMLVGSASMSITAVLASNPRNDSDGFDQMMGPVQVLFTTIVQGLLLNLEIFGLAIVIYAIACLFGIMTNVKN